MAGWPKHFTRDAETPIIRLHGKPKATWVWSHNISSPRIMLNQNNSWPSPSSDFSMFLPLRRWLREWCVKVVFSFKGREEKLLKKTGFDCWEITLAFTPSLPPSLPAYPHHCSRQYKNPTGPKYTDQMEPQCFLNTQPSDDARAWYKLVMCKQE